ncbi:MipA/OmpV family protein [Stakelama flava]|uniref:MipA/OmpV family protein n=1 Tax=Stakelama flava TaxID=2860338 RepID=UPI0031BAF0CF
MLIRLFCAAGLAAATLHPALAQTADPADSLAGDRVTVGIGAASVPDYEGADTNNWNPAALVNGKVSGIDFWSRGTQLYVDLVPDAPGPGTNFSAGPIAGVRLNRTGDIDNPQVAALGKLDTAYELGGFVGISRTGVITSDYDTLSARVAVVADVAGAYDSYVVTPQISYTTPLSRQTLVGLSASADYVGKGYGRTYFSVTPEGSVVSGLRTYDISDSGFKSASFGLYGIQSISGDLLHGFGIGGGVFYTRMLGKYKDSPIVSDVGDADQFTVGAGLTYTF